MNLDKGFDDGSRNLDAQAPGPAGRHGRAGLVTP